MPGEPLRRLLESSAGGPEERAFLLAGLHRGAFGEEDIRGALAERADLAARGDRHSLADIVIYRCALSPQAIQILQQDAAAYLQRIRSAPPPLTPPEALRGVAAEAPAAAEPPAAPAAEAGAPFGEFLILGEIARGGMGVVYRARDAAGRVVALKVSRAGKEATRTELARFQREAQAAAAISHPNVVKVHQAGRIEGYDYFTMDYIDGESLDRYVRHVEPREILRVVRDACFGLHAIHEAGMVHRDMKPQNILVDRSGTPRVTDFGLAKVLSAEALTRSGVVMGTPFYLSPEQAAGQAKHLDRRSDIFSVGVILYEALAGHLPFRGETPLALYREIIEKEPEVLSAANPAVPPEVSRIVAKAIEKDPARRYPTARDLADDIGRHLGGEEVLARSPGALARLTRRVRRLALPLAAGLAALGLAAAGAHAGLGWWRAREARATQAAAEDAIRSLLQEVSTLRAEAQDRARAGDPEGACERLERAAARLAELSELAAAPVPDPAALDALVRSQDVEALTGDICRLLGLYYRVRGDTPRAVASLRRAADLLAAESPAVREELGLTLLDAGDAEGALAAADEALAAAPGDRDLLCLRAAALEALARYAEAAATYDAIPGTAAGGESVLLGRARARWLAGDREAARRDLEVLGGGAAPTVLLADLLLADGSPVDALLALERAGGASPDDPAVRRTRARIQLRSGRPDLAAVDLEVARAVEPESSETFALLARTRLALDDAAGFREALAAYVAAAGPSSCRVPVEAAYLAYLAGDGDGALASLARLIASSPRLVLARTVRARILLDRGDVPGALVDARAAFEVNPHDPDGVLLLAAARLGAGDTAGALGAVAPLVSPDPVLAAPRNPEALLVHAQALAAVGRTEEAAPLAALARSYLEGSGGPAAAFLVPGRNDLSIGMARHDKDASERGIRLLLAAARCSPVLAEPLRRVAAERLFAGDAAAARDALDEACRRDPTHPDALVGRARLLLDAGEVEMAVSDASRAEAFDSSNLSVRAAYADALTAAGRPAEAARLFDGVDPASLWDEEAAAAGARALDAAARPEDAARFRARADALRPENRRSAAREIRAACGPFPLSDPRRLALLEEAIRWEPESRETCTLLNHCLEQQGHVERAMLLEGRLCLVRPDMYLHVSNYARSLQSTYFDLEGLAERIGRGPLPAPFEHAGRAFLDYFRIRDRTAESPRAVLPFAVADIELALASRPDAGLYHALRGVLVARWGYAAPALAEADLARALAPDVAGVAVLLAELHAYLGDRDAAARELLRVRDLTLDLGVGDRAQVSRLYEHPLFDGVRDHPLLREPPTDPGEGR